MVAAALDRLDRALVRAGHDSVKAQLAPGRASRAVRRELTALGIDSAADLVAWFSYHDGGWLEPAKLQLLSFDEAIEHRMDLSQDLLVPFRSTWFPISAESTETTILDTATGAVLFHDLERGDDEATRLEPSLAAWVDSTTRRIGGGSGFSFGRSWSAQGSISSVDDLRREARRALGGLAKAARRSADWLEQRQAALEKPEPVPSPELEERAIDESPESTSSSASAEPIATERIAEEVEAETWTPGRGEVACFEELADGRVAVLAKHTDGLDLYVLTPAQGVIAAFVAEIPTTAKSTSLVASPVADDVLVNNTWLYDLDEMSGRRVDEFAGQTLGRGAAKATFSRDGRYVHLRRAQRRDIVGESADGTLQWETLPARSEVLDLAAGRVVAHAMTEDQVPPTLVGDHLLGVVANDGESVLRVDGIDGESRIEIPLGAGSFTGPIGGMVSKSGNILIAAVTHHRFFIIDLATRDHHDFANLHPLAVSDDGASLFAIEPDYPTSPAFIVNTSTYTREPFGWSQPEDTDFDYASDGTRLAHVVVSPGGTLSIQYMDWSLGVSSDLPIWPEHQRADVVRRVLLGDKAVVFLDIRSSGEPTFAVSPVDFGQLGPAIDIGDNARPDGAAFASRDGTHVVWSTDQGLRWCATDGSGLRALPRREQSRGWILTSTDHVIVNEGSHLAIGPLSSPDSPEELRQQG